MTYDLHDIHLPEPISFWPPALGWWIVAGLFLLLLIIGAWTFYRYYFKPIRRVALKELKQLHHRYQQNADSTQFIIALSILLRRVALATYPRHQVPVLKGTAWLQFLDKTGQTQAFTNGVGQVLSTAPYQKSPQIETEALFHLVELWIKQQ